MHMFPILLFLRPRLLLAQCSMTQLAGGVANGNADGVGTSASFGAPACVAQSPFNLLLYVTDYVNCNVRQVDLGGTVVTIAGTASCGAAGPVNGSSVPGPSASFNNPWGVDARAADGAVVVADTLNGALRLLMPPSGAAPWLVYTLAEGFAAPVGVALSPDGGSVLVADYAAATIYRFSFDSATSVAEKLASASLVMAGSPFTLGAEDGAAALLRAPVLLDWALEDLTCVFTDANSALLRVLKADGAGGTTTTIAGSLAAAAFAAASGIDSPAAGFADGAALTAAAFSAGGFGTGLAQPRALAGGALLVVDAGNNALRALPPDWSTVRTLALPAALSAPSGLAAARDVDVLFVTEVNPGAPGVKLLVGCGGAASLSPSATPSGAATPLATPPATPTRSPTSTLTGTRTPIGAATGSRSPSATPSAPTSPSRSPSGATSASPALPVTLAFSLRASALVDGMALLAAVYAPEAVAVLRRGVARGAALPGGAASVRLVRLALDGGAVLSVGRGDAVNAARALRPRAATAAAANATVAFEADVPAPGFPGLSALLRDAGALATALNESRALLAAKLGTQVDVGWDGVPPTALGGGVGGGDGGYSGAGVAAIAVACVAATVLLAASVYLYLRERQKLRDVNGPPPTPPPRGGVPRRPGGGGGGGGAAAALNALAQLLCPCCASRPRPLRGTGPLRSTAPQNALYAQRKPNAPAPQTFRQLPGGFESSNPMAARRAT
jgi:hypothetical protein